VQKVEQTNISSEFPSVRGSKLFWSAHAVYWFVCLNGQKNRAVGGVTTKKLNRFGHFTTCLS